VAVSIKKYFSTRPQSLFTAFGFVLVKLIGVLDYRTGPVFSSLVFYLVHHLGYLVCRAEDWNLDIGRKWFDIDYP
jgi:hypothetical protein